MGGGKNRLIFLGWMIAVSLIASSAAVMLVSYRDHQYSFALVNAVCGEIAEQKPEAKPLVSAALKKYLSGNVGAVENCRAEERPEYLPIAGYRKSDILGSVYRQNVLFAIAGVLTGIFLFLSIFWMQKKRKVLQIQSLVDYLEQVNTGKVSILSFSGEDDFSKLKDEMDKTVTFLYQTKDDAVRARNNFAQNLSNIAHQIKTPITAISLSVQMMKQRIEANCCRDDEDNAAQDVQTNCHREFDMNYHLEQAEKQLLRLTHLEEALLVLSRIDAGTLHLEKREEDVFTLLMLAADNLQELFSASGALVEIPEAGEMMVEIDLDWTLEAVMNLMKNCMEHGNGGIIHCSYAQNSLFTEIRIWDDGEGFAKEDVPHLFERFYRGKNAGPGGIGIGLALAKEMIERQNGTIQAENRPEGGALFEIHFYCH